jgi:N-acyl amino acid synthase of PEP-CTERM/exosortase system
MVGRTGVIARGLGREVPVGAPYRTVPLDDSAQLLNLSYRLRYQSFCLERLFFSKDQFPTELESDAFDRNAAHVGVLNARDELVGTARVIMPSSAGLPLLRHCALYPFEAGVLSEPGNTVVELSRVCVNRLPNRRRGEQGLSASDALMSGGHSVASRPGRDSNDAFLTLIKGMYQATKRLRGTHWLIAVEKPLFRRIRRYGLPFRQVGPEADYFGPVAPYLMSIAELDDIIRSGKYPKLEDFPAGLEFDDRTAALAASGAEVRVS